MQISVLRFCLANNTGHVPITSPQRRYQHSFLAFFILCLCGLSFGSQALQGQELRDHKGREFFVTFLPNWHNQPTELEDSLYLFISSEKEARVRIEFFDKQGNPYSESFQLRPGVMQTFSRVYRNFELDGVRSPSGSVASATPQNQRAAPQVFYVTSDEEVTVYGLNEARWTSDAFLALPKDVLGTEYLVMTYPTDNQAVCQFAIVATEDDTRITVEPKARTATTGRTDPLDVRLNARQAYLVQGLPGTSTDLTGTRIVSDKPIALFSGHQRSKIPQTIDLVSRDHLVQQVPPIPSWGGSAFITPYPQPIDADNESFDRYRVLAAEDNTQIFIDGIPARTLNAGEFMEDFIFESQWITATGPILVTQFKKSANTTNGDFKNGDPFMLINSPTEQYLDDYFCTNVTAWLNGQEVYAEDQFITIVAPTRFLSTVRLDGRPIDKDAWEVVSITTYSFTRALRVATGTHTITADTTVGVYVFGYGDADSYGYIGGMKFDSISTFDPPDIIPPLAFLGACGDRVYRGAVFDTLAFDKGVQTVEAPEDDWDNVRVRIGEFPRPADSVEFFAELVDPYQDGSFSLYSLDSTGADRRESFVVPGFTVNIENAGSDMRRESGHIGVGDEFERCFQFNIENYGSFPQTIDRLSFSNFPDAFNISTQLPIDIPPGESRQIEICLSTEIPGYYLDTLEIANECVDRQVLAFELRAEGPPIIEGEPQCFELNGAITDSLAVDSRIVTARAVPGSEQNVTLSVDPFNAPAKAVTFSAQLLDRFQDGQFSVEAEDSLGLRTATDVEIPGFTVYSDLPVPQIKVIDEIGRAGRQTCYPITLMNYGKHPQTVNRLSFQNNSASLQIVPAEVTIPPGERVEIQICLTPSAQGQLNDTLSIGNDCIERKIAAVSILAALDEKDPEITRSSDECNTRDRMVISDLLETDWGIETIEITNSINIRDLEIDESEAPQQVVITAFVDDPSADAIYGVAATDSAGNTIDTTVVIQGFSIDFVGTIDGSYDFGDQVVGFVVCDSIEISNSSSFPFMLEEAELQTNTRFSLPLSQFPIEVPPGGPGWLLVCFEPNQVRDFNDLIEFKKYCVEKQLNLLGAGGDFTLSANSNCDVQLSVRLQQVPEGLFIEQNFPNPASESTSLIFGIPRDAHVLARLYNFMGNEVGIITDTYLKGGIYHALIELSTFESGLYYYELIVDGERLTMPVNVVK